jgi:hypothetical protein
MYHEIIKIIDPEKLSTNIETSSSFSTFNSTKISNSKKLTGFRSSSTQRAQRADEIK